MIHKQKLFILASLILVSALSAHAQTLCSWQDIIQNSLGQGNPNATIIVLSGTTGGTQAVNTSTQPGTPLATIYSDPYGASPINQTTNPVTTAAGNGWFQYWTACGSYQVIQVYGAGVNGQLTYGIFVGGGPTSGGTVQSVAPVTPIVTTPNPITGTGTVSCPTCVVTVTGTGPIASSGGTTPAISCPTCVTGFGAQSSGYTFYPSSASNCGTYNIGGTTFCALNNGTGVIDFSGTNAATVINSAITAKATVGGRFLFKLGTYLLNSATVETATGCSTFTSDSKPLAWVVGIPAVTPLSSEVQWVFEGEAGAPPQGESLTTSVNPNGVIFEVTPAAIASVTSGAFINGIFQRPGENCTLSFGAGFGNVSNDIQIKYIDVRFPTNQRGNEAGINLWFGASHSYDTVTADFNLSANAIATGSAPVVGTYGSFGLTSTISGSGNWQHESNTWAVGWDICYDWESELLTVDHPNAIYCNHAAEIGRAATTVFHPILINYFTEQENAGGIILGPEMAQGGRLDMFAYDPEISYNGWYSRAAIGMVETNCGYTSGIITFAKTVAQVGHVSGGVFSTCGQNFQTFSGVTAPNIQLTPVSDTFTHPDFSPAAGLGGLGPSWDQSTSVNDAAWTIASNKAVPASGNVSGSVAAYSAMQAPTIDQFAQVTGASLATTDQWGAGIRYQVVSSYGPANGYLCLSLGSGTNTLQIYKAVSGSYSTIGSSASYTQSSGDVMQMYGYGSLLTCQVTRSGATVASTYVIDTTYTTGYPWIYAFQNSAASAPGLTNFSGGSLPPGTNSQSIYTQPFPFTQLIPILVASLPAAAAGNAGQIRTVSDSTSISAEGQTCVGSDSNSALAFSNGIVWKCF